MFDPVKFNDIEEFKKFLESKGDATFHYHSNDNCCFAQWAKACGGKTANAGGFSIVVDRNTYDIPMEFEIHRPLVGAYDPNSKFSAFLHNIKNNIVLV